MNPLAIAKACLQAYVDKDRPAIESLVHSDFHFTSPMDNRLDRATYFERCWPNSTAMDAATVVWSAETDDRAVVVYEAEAGGKRFRNCELYAFRDGQLVSTEVYFGWNLPHPAAPGGFVNPDGQ